VFKSKDLLNKHEKYQIHMKSFDKKENMLQKI